MRYFVAMSLLIILLFASVRCFDPDDVDNCNCAVDRRPDFGFTGLYSEDPSVNSTIPNYCRESWISEEILRNCWRIVYGLDKVNWDLDPKGVEHPVSASLFRHRYKFKLSAASLRTVKRSNVYPCDLIKKYKCYRHNEDINREELPTMESITDTMLSDGEANETILPMPETPFHKMPSSTYYSSIIQPKNKSQPLPPIMSNPIIEKIISNIPVESMLDDDAGPATNPKDGVLLFGYYYAAFKDKISFYYVVNEDKIEVKTNCDCALWDFKQDVFKLFRYRCQVGKNGCDISYKTTSMRVSYEESQNHCDNDHIFIRARYPRPTSFKDKHQREHYILCNNGTIMEEKDGLRFTGKLQYGSVLCEAWSMIDTYEQCDGDRTSSNCEIGDIKYNDARGSIQVKPKPSGMVTVKTSEGSSKVSCMEECTINVKKDNDYLLIICPNGESREYHKNHVEVNCPFIGYYMPRYLSVYACKATYRPNLLWAFLLILVIGKKITGLIYYLLDGLIFIIAILVKYMTNRRCSRRKIFDPAFCNHCDEIVDSEYVKDRHINCHKGICPYCSNKFKELKAHAPECKLKCSTLTKLNNLFEKDVEENGSERPMCRIISGFPNRSHFKSKIPTSVWIITLIIMFGFLVAPVKAEPCKNSEDNKISYLEKNMLLIIGLMSGSLIIYFIYVSDVPLSKSRTSRTLLRLHKLKNILTKKILGERECAICGLPNFEISRSNDHALCIKNCCPYCYNIIKGDWFKNHVFDCRADYWEDRLLRFHRFNKNFYRSLMVFTILLICFSPCYCKTPSEMHEDKLDEWSLRVMSDDGCANSCFHNKDDCCPLSASRLIQSNIYSHINKKKKKINYKPNLAINDTFLPIINERTIDLTFETKSESKGQMIISAKSNIIMEIDKLSGITWVLSGEGTKEKIKLNIGIKSSGQKYKTRFNYWFADRLVQYGSDNTCTGDCQSDCGCKSKTCRIHKEENKRNWRCNPTWCWNIGGGCSCCYMEATLISPKFLIAEFSVEYLETFIELCVSISTGKYKCKLVSHNSNFDVDSVKIKFSKAYDVQKKLPEKIHLVYKVYEKHFDITHPDFILIDTDICSASNCRHGEVGDYRFTNLTTMLYEGGEKHNEIGVEMIWGGVQQGMDCVSFHWPTCTSEGITIQNSDMFDNLIKTSKDIHTDFEAIETHVKLDKDFVPGLSLVVNPKSNAGNIEVFLSVDGMRINKEHKRINVRNFRIRSCDGCKNCLNGFYCIVDVSLNSPDEAYIHIKPDTDVLVKGEETIIATKKIQTYNLTFFSAIDIDSITLCIEETGDCKSKDGITLKLPEGRLSNEGTFYRIKSKDDGQFDLSKIGDMLSNFFVNIWGFIKSLVVSPLFYIAIVLLILFYGGFAISKLLLGYNRFNTRKLDFSKEKNP